MNPSTYVLCWGDSRLSNILYGPQFEVAAVRGLGDRLHRRSRGRSGLAAVHRLGAVGVSRACRGWTGTPGREETIERYQQLSGLPVRNLRYNEMLAARRPGLPGVAAGDQVSRTRDCSPTTSTSSGSASNGSGSCWTSASRPRARRCWRSAPR